MGSGSLSSSTTFELGVDLGDLEVVFLRNVPPESFNYAQRVGRAGRRADFPGFTITYCRRSPHDLYHFAEPERMLSGKIRAPVVSISNEKIVSRHMIAVALSAFFRGKPERFAKVQGLFGDLETPDIVETFRGFLQENRSMLEDSLRRIVPEQLLNVLRLHNGDWIDLIAGPEGRLASAELELSSDFRAAKELQRTSGNQHDHRTLRWANARLNTIKEEDVLSFLSRKAVIPKYGFPVDVAELDIQSTLRNADASGVSLQRDLSLAVAEFAPSSKLIANKKVWTSFGLKRVAEKEWARWWYGKCRDHNIFIRGRQRNDIAEARCCPKMVPKEYIDPLFGFTTNQDAPEEPKRRPERIFVTRPFFAGFTQADGAEIQHGMITLRKTTPGYMVVLCEGKQGRGFFICPECGAGLKKPNDIGHRTPMGRRCGNTRLVRESSIGHEFVTDVLQINLRNIPQIEGNDSVSNAYSLAYALVEGAAEVLQVPSTDLNATVASVQHELFPSIILYDNVPGGAGLVERLEEKDLLRTCLEAALNRVSGQCGCEEATSCYGCLRSYRNQFAHEFLARGPVRAHIEWLLA
jgi:hypothetical protein